MAALLPLHLHLRPPLVSPEARTPATSVGGALLWTPGAARCRHCCGGGRVLRTRAHCTPVSKEDTQLTEPSPAESPPEEASSEDLEYVQQTKLAEPSPAESPPEEASPENLDNVQQIKLAEPSPAESSPEEASPEDLDNVQQIKLAEPSPAESPPEQASPEDLENVQRIKLAEPSPAESQPEEARSEDLGYVQQIKLAEPSPAESPAEEASPEDIDNVQQIKLAEPSPAESLPEDASPEDLDNVQQIKLAEPSPAESPPEEASLEDLDYIQQIKRVLDLLRKNRDMLFNEVKLTIMIEDPRDLERKRLMGIDPDEITRDDLAAALEDVHEGRIPENRVALRMLAEEMNSWPNLEVETTKKNRTKSKYAKATDTGVDPVEAAKRLNIDWDSAAEIEGEEEADELEVPPAVGYGALYLVTGLPVLIGISVVLILFYNSLQ